MFVWSFRCRKAFLHLLLTGVIQDDVVTCGFFCKTWYRQCTSKFTSGRSMKLHKCMSQTCNNSAEAVSCQDRKFSEFELLCILVHQHRNRSRHNLNILLKEFTRRHYRIGGILFSSGRHHSCSDLLLLKQGMFYLKNYLMGIIQFTSYLFFQVLLIEPLLEIAKASN